MNIVDFFLFFFLLLLFKKEENRNKTPFLSSLFTISGFLSFPSSLALVTTSLFSRFLFLFQKNLFSAATLTFRGECVKPFAVRLDGLRVNCNFPAPVFLGCKDMPFLRDKCLTFIATPRLISLLWSLHARVATKKKKKRSKEFYTIRKVR